MTGSTSASGATRAAAPEMPESWRAGASELAGRVVRAGVNRVGLPAVELVLRRRSSPRDGGVTVVAVSYLAMDCAQTLAWAVRHFSPPDTQLIIVDNASGPELRRWLGQDQWFRSVVLPLNIGHGRAMDLGFALARTEYVVALDIDAFPISADWLDVTLAPAAVGRRRCRWRRFSLRCDGARRDGLVMAGYAGKPFVHPSLLAMRRSRFVHVGTRFGISRRTGTPVSASPDSSRATPSSSRRRSGDRVWWAPCSVASCTTTSIRPASERTLGPRSTKSPRRTGRAWDEALDRYLRPLPGFPAI